MTSNRKIVRFISKRWMPNVRDAYGLELRYEVVDERYIGLPEESSETLAGRLVVGASGTLATCWGLGDDDLALVLSEYARRHLHSRLFEGYVPDNEQLLLTPHNTPEQLPFDPSRIAPIEEPFVVIEDASASWTSGEIQGNAGDIISLRDNINALTVERYGFRLFTLVNERQLFELTRPCTTVEEFSHRLAAFAVLVTSMDTKALQEELGSSTNGSLNLLGELLRRDFPEAPIDSIMNCLRSGNRLRQMYPMHTDTADGVLEAHRYFRLPYPIMEYDDAWNAIKNAYRQALDKLLALLAVSESL